MSFVHSFAPPVANKYFGNIFFRLDFHCFQKVNEQKTRLLPSWFWIQVVYILNTKLAWQRGPDNNTNNNFEKSLVVH